MSSNKTTAINFQLSQILRQLKNNVKILTFSIMDFIRTLSASDLKSYGIYQGNASTTKRTES